MSDTPRWYLFCDCNTASGKESKEVSSFLELHAAHVEDPLPL